MRTLPELLAFAGNKTNFTRLGDYIDFARAYLDFIAEGGLQAVIVARNEPQYRFFQYGSEAGYAVTRPLHFDLLYDAASSDRLQVLPDLLHSVRELAEDSESRLALTRSVYTLQQCIGATLDALPAGESNTARKVNGDLFERLILLVLQETGVNCLAGTVSVPVYADGELAFKMNYQQDLLLYQGEELKAIGSVKTSSKDRLDKIFLDKFLYNRLTERETPHFAIFLNDVQRKATIHENVFAVNATFLTGHFKAFTIKLTPLDGVYYCDLRPNMERDPLLRQHIRRFDELLTRDLWLLLDSEERTSLDVA